MSRTVESVIIDQLGSVMLQSAQLIAKLEAAKERIAELEKLIPKSKVSPIKDVADG